MEHVRQADRQTDSRHTCTHARTHSHIHPHTHTHTEKTHIRGHNRTQSGGVGMCPSSTIPPAHTSKTWQHHSTIAPHNTTSHMERDRRSLLTLRSVAHYTYLHFATDQDVENKEKFVININLTTWLPLIQRETMNHKLGISSSNTHAIHCFKKWLKKMIWGFKNRRITIDS